jgi:predicted transcriptional regulator
LAEIEAGIAEVDKGEFAEPAEVARVIAKFMAPLRSTLASVLFVGVNGP